MQYRITVTAVPSDLARGNNKPYIDWIRQLTGDALADGHRKFCAIRDGMPLSYVTWYRPTKPAPLGLSVEVEEILTEQELKDREAAQLREFMVEKFQNLLKEGAEGFSGSAVEACRMLIKDPTLIGHKYIAAGG